MISQKCDQSVSPKNLSSDDHFDRPFSFTAMRGDTKPVIKQEKGTTMNLLTQLKKTPILPLLTENEKEDEAFKGGNK
jgi:hypothetical protein